MTFGTYLDKSEGAEIICEFLFSDLCGKSPDKNLLCLSPVRSLRIKEVASVKMSERYLPQTGTSLSLQSRCFLKHASL